jgi:beta-galactosidase
MNFIKKHPGRILFSFSLVLSFGWLPAARPATEIFDAQPAAKKFISFDERSFLIQGMKTFLISGSIHYTRVPRELWQDRLLRAKTAGFNAITTYVFWNAHEPENGQFDFSGNKDLSAFLKLCTELRTFVIVRLGPYSCAEIDLGGFPAWLAVEKGVRLRTDDPEYLKYVDAWFEKLLPIVAQHQVHKGGCVIMVQLENEYKGEGDTEEDPYLAHLQKKALEMGIEVPMFFSGLHHGHDPAGDTPWPRTGKSPWFTTEFWTGWYDRFGELSEEEIDRYDRATRKIMAFGGAGYNYYMLHGGTNWGYTSNDEISTSYDFAAPIGESGALRKSYFRFKRDAIFAASFAHILSRGTTDEKGLAVSSGDLDHYLCRTPRGNILFLDNSHAEPITTKIKIEKHLPIPMVKPMTLLPGEIVPVFVDYPMGGGVTIAHCAANLLTMRRLRDRSFIFLYGREKQYGEIVFQLKGSLRLISGIDSYIIDATGSTLIVSFEFPGEWEKKDFAFTCGLANIQVVALNENLAGRIWVDPLRGRPAIVVGPYYLPEIDQEDKSLRVAAQFRGDEEACYIYTGDPMAVEEERSSGLISFQRDQANLCLNGKLSAFSDPPEVPHLGEWRFAPAAPEASPGFDDSDWVSSENPTDMGAMPGAHRTFYGWYRCGFESPEEGSGKVEFPFAGDTIYVFVNGNLVGKADERGPQSVSVPVQKGKNLLAVLARHSGRDKLYSFKGVAGLKVATGIHGPVKLSTDSSSQVLKGWRYRPGLVGEQEGWFRPQAESAVKWRPLSETKRPEIPTFFAGSFRYRRSPGFSDVLRLKTTGLSRGTLWLNGRIIGQYVPGGEYYLPEPWLQSKNLVVIADEQGKSPEHVSLVREPQATSRTLEVYLKAPAAEEPRPRPTGEQEK